MVQHNEEGRGLGQGGTKNSKSSLVQAYLIRIHFELADNLDGDFVSSLGISGFVDIAEGAVAHLFHEDESFQAWVLRHLVGFLSFFCNNGFYVRVVELLIFARRVGCSTAHLSCDIAIIAGCDGILARLRKYILLKLSRMDS